MSAPGCCNDRRCADDIPSESINLPQAGHQREAAAAMDYDKTITTRKMLIQGISDQWYPARDVADVVDHMLTVFYPGSYSMDRFEMPTEVAETIEWHAQRVVKPRTMQAGTAVRAALTVALTDALAALGDDTEAVKATLGWDELWDYDPQDVFDRIERFVRERVNCGYVTAHMIGIVVDGMTFQYPDRVTGAVRALIHRSASVFSKSPF